MRQQNHKNRHKNTLIRSRLVSFVLSNVLILLTIGLPLLWFLFKVYSMAKSSRSSNNNNYPYILIPGLKLENNNIMSDFSLRLQRALSLYNSGNKQQKLIILGGITHKNSISEAEAGARYLLKYKIKSNNIILENQSQNTMENLKNAREIISSSSCFLISNRFHLYRIKCFARGLNLTITPIAAEEHFNLSIKMLLDCFKEAYFVHWYFSGKLWLLLSGDKSSKAYIS